jgi:iron(III) transport system permease protein
VPALVGVPGNVNVLSTSIFEAISLKSPPQYGQASAFSVILLVIVFVLLRFYSRLLVSAQKFQTISGKGYRSTVIPLGPWRYVTAAILAAFFFILIVAPVGMLSFASLQSFYSRISLGAFQTMTLDNYASVLTRRDFRNALVNTFILGAGTATVVTAITALCAWFVVRRIRGAAALDFLATMPLTFPAIVLGVAFLEIFLRLPLPVYGTLTGLVFASVVAYLPYGMRYAYVAVLQISRALEEAGATSGATNKQIFGKIVIPLIGSGLLTCWLFLFLVCVRGVAMAVMLAGTQSQVVAVTLFDLWQNGQTPQLAAMGVLWMGLMTVVSLGFYVATRRFGVLLG